MPDAAARLRALPRPHEHLRRPRQPAAARAPLRVARDRLRASPRPALGDAIDPDAHDLFYLGGGQDRDQRALRARPRRDQARRAARRGRRGRARPRRLRRLPAARPLLRARRRADPRRRPRRPAHRARGGAAADRQRRDRGRPRPDGRACSPASRTTAGARTSAPASSRSAACSRATATTARSGYEGVRRGSVIGTYLHGPLLPKNAWFADWLIATALGADATSRRSTTRSRTPRTAGPPGRRGLI